MIGRLFAAAALVVACTQAWAAAPAMLPGSDGASDPLVAVDPYGVTYVAGTVNGGAKLWRVDPSGTTSPAPGGALAALPGGAPAGLGIDAGANVHLAELGSTVTVRRSIDGGESWDRGTPFAAPVSVAAALGVSRFNSIVEGATLTLATQSKGVLLVSRSTDGGLSFAPASIVDADCDTGCRLGGVVVDESGDRVAVAYTNAGGGLVLATSSDGARTFDLDRMGAIPAGRPAVAATADGYAVVWPEPESLTVAIPTPGGWRVDRIGGHASSVSVAARGTTLAAAFCIEGTPFVATSANGAPFATTAVAPSSNGCGGTAIAPDPSGGFVAAFASADGIGLFRQG